MEPPEFFRMHYCRLCRLEQPVSQPLAPSVADLCLSLVLAGAARHKTQPAQLLNLLRIIKPRYIAYLGQDPGKDVPANPRYFQKILRSRNRPASVRKFCLHITQLPVQFQDLFRKPFHRLFGYTGTILQAHALLRIPEALSSPAVAAPPQFRPFPDFTDALRPNLLQILWERCCFQQFHGECTVHFSQCVLIFGKADCQFPVQPVQAPDPVFRKLVAEHGESSHISVHFLRQVRHPIVPVLYQVGDQFRVFPVILELAVVLQFLCLFYRIWVDLHYTDAVRH